jgi:Na+-translocating ferredoxin:NAD+ oxidoreductase subunit B
LTTDQFSLEIDALLPQTQCRKCGYQGCLPYAQAISRDEADINQCPPGGEQVIAKLAALLNKPVKPLNPAFGEHRPRMLAVIDEAECIGCCKCIPPCPVDAIIGAAKQMHSVITSLCTGCELCIAPCPVDCISMQPADLPWTETEATLSRQRHYARNQRLTALEEEKIQRLNRQKEMLKSLPPL